MVISAMKANLFINKNSIYLEIRVAIGANTGGILNKVFLKISQNS